MKAKITAKLETSDHDGYCSGNECEYECEIITHTIDTIPDIYKTHPKGMIDDLNEYDWISFLPEPKLNLYESYYCDVSYHSKLNGLDKHDYKYTVLSVELFSDS
jgi:hypothetical protein